MIHSLGDPLAREVRYLGYLEIYNRPKTLYYKSYIIQTLDLEDKLIIQEYNKNIRQGNNKLYNTIYRQLTLELLKEYL